MTIKHVTRDEFVAMFDSSVHDALTEHLARTDVAGICCFECLDMSSSQCGRRTAVIFGPGCTYKAEPQPDEHLYDLPSQRQYPVAIYLKEQPE